MIVNSVSDNMLSPVNVVIPVTVTPLLSGTTGSRFAYRCLVVLSYRRPRSDTTGSCPADRCLVVRSWLHSLARFGTSGKELHASSTYTIKSQLSLSLAPSPSPSPSPYPSLSPPPLCSFLSLSRPPLSLCCFL